MQAEPKWSRKISNNSKKNNHFANFGTTKKKKFRKIVLKISNENFSSKNYHFERNIAFKYLSKWKAKIYWIRFKITTKAFSRSILARFELNLRGKKWLNHTQSGLTKNSFSCCECFVVWILFFGVRFRLFPERCFFFIDDVFLVHKIKIIQCLVYSYTVPAALSWVKTMWPSSDLFRNWYLLERNTACFLRTP